MATCFYQKYDQPYLIQQLTQKIEKLIYEISKLTTFSNKLLDEIKLHEIQNATLRQQFLQIWNYLSPDKRIQFNLQKTNVQYGVKQPLQLLEVSRLITEMEDDLKTYKNNSYAPTVHQCYECKSKDSQIETLQAKLKYQTQIIVAFQKKEKEKDEFEEKQQNQLEYRTFTETEFPIRKRGHNYSQISASTKISNKPMLFELHKTKK